MIISKNRIISFLIIIFAIILIDLIFYKIAMPADGAQIVIDENLRPGMKLKDAIEFLGSPETLTVSDAGTVIIPYNNHGLSIEVASQGSIIEKIGIYSGFKGRFLSGIEIGADFRQILSAYNQPDMMTKEVIEYSDGPRRFYINDGKLTGADLYSATSTLYNQIINKENVVKDNVSEATPEKVNMEVREEVREALREELRDEVREELREEVLDEV
ncbi:MAG: hypothetical protein JXL81_01120, partial [Deltaproteobacteria bacterium]|nr:hypothetical protein [Deltaproteobacteria bacterium]